MKYGQRAGANLPEDLRKLINATHSRTKTSGSKARSPNRASGNKRQKLLKGVSKTYKKPLDIVKERKTKRVLHVDEEDRHDTTSEPEEDFYQDSGRPVTSARRRSVQKNTAESAFDSDRSTTSNEPLPRVSRATNAALEEDDAQIATLEKKLGLKNGRKVAAYSDDIGLGEILGSLGKGPEKKRKHEEYEAFLRSKRRRNSKQLMTEIQPEPDDSTEDGRSDEDIESSDGGFGDLPSDDNAELSDGFSSFDSDTMEERRPVRVRENPYRPPTLAGESENKTPKYIPPSLRGAASSDVESLARLKRLLQGQLNRLSESNLLSILKEVEKVYSTNARQHVTSTLIDLLLGLLCDKTSLNDTFIILHAGFIAAVYKVVGEQFGAQFIERLVSSFDRFYAEQKESGSSNKETTNLIALLADLYAFQVINSQLMFDFIRFFLQEISDLNTELLLKSIKSCGPQLRKDDPLSLKDIVMLLQKSVAQVGESNLSVRTRYMIETIDNLKNNRQKTGIVASQLASEHMARMKRTLAALNDRNLKATEPLGIGLNDVRSSNKDGKWWLVGASWKAEYKIAETHLDASNHSKLQQSQSDQPDPEHEDSPTEDKADLTTLARTLRLNTEVRRAIFHAIMSATDYQDAFARLTKLRLSATQSQEISRVLLLLTAAEEPYNPYYALVARKLCTAARKYRMNFQFGLWGIFRRLGEQGRFAEDDEEEEEGDGEGVGLRGVVSYARFFGQLVADGALGLGVLRVLSPLLLQPKTKILLEVMLVTVFTRVAAKEKGTEAVAAKLQSIFAALAEHAAFAAGLRPVPPRCRAEERGAGY